MDRHSIQDKQPVQHAGGGRILHTTESSEGIRNERKINVFDAEDLSDHDLGSVLEQLILDIVNKSDS